MSGSPEFNDLDQTIMKLRKSQAALPDFMRALGEGELHALVPWHPEVEDEMMGLENGDAIPFVQLEEKDGTVVPVFSSYERAREAVKRARVPSRTYSIATMDAKELLHILGHAGLRAEVNKSCKTGGVIIGPEMMRDVASGEAFEAAGPGPTEEVGLKILDAADYPTHLVQPVFELMRQHTCFRAAWIFGRTKAQGEPEGGRGYRLLVLMLPEDRVLFRDLNLVANASKGKGNELDLGLIPANDGTYTEQLFQAARPFYIAEDYPVPPGAKE